MVIGILNFGDGMLWLNYWIFCIVGSFGALQIAAAQARLRGLLLLPPRASKWLGVILVAGAYVWFFSIQPDLFIPGLAGGEFFIEFFTGFVLAVVLALLLGILSNRIWPRAAARTPYRREVVALGRGQSGELWLPAQAKPPLVIGLREGRGDSLDLLSGQLVASGAAVLLCNEGLAFAAMEFAQQHAGRFHAARRYAMGVGRGADRALELASSDPALRGVVALAPFGQEHGARPGLHWLCETDYWSAFRATWRKQDIVPAGALHHALVVYGDEDLLIRPGLARQLFPAAVMVAGARHWTLAAMPTTWKLAADWFEVHEPAASAEVYASALPGEVRE